MLFRPPHAVVLFATLMAAGPALGQVPGGAGDLSPHIDIGVDAATGQLIFGFTDIEADTPIVIDNFINTLPSGGGGFTNIPFTSDQDIAFRTASDSIATGLGFTSFDQFGEGSPAIAAEVVELDPFFEAFAFPVFINEPGESFTLNNSGQFIDFHPTYILATDDSDFIGRVEASFSFVPLTNTDVFSASDPLKLIFVVGGDFDDDSRLTDVDRAALEAAIDSNSTETQFDLNRDMVVDDDDLTFWLTELLGVPATIDGDYNGDGFVSQADLDLVLLNWGDADLPAGFDIAALPGGGPFDDLISQNELDGVLLNWGNGTAPSVTAIPEPGTAVAVLGVLAGLATRRRR